jgi:hypothetical protein
MVTRAKITIIRVTRVTTKAGRPMIKSTSSRTTRRTMATTRAIRTTRTSKIARRRGSSCHPSRRHTLRRSHQIGLRLFRMLMTMNELQLYSININSLYKFAYT